MFGLCLAPYCFRAPRTQIACSLRVATVDGCVTKVRRLAAIDRDASEIAAAAGTAVVVITVSGAI